MVNWLSQVKVNDSESMDSSNIFFFKKTAYTIKTVFKQPIWEKKSIRKIKLDGPKSSN